MTSDLKQEKMTNLLQSPLSAELITLWTDFLEQLRHNNGELLTHTRLVVIRKVAATVGIDTCRALIGLHA